ncbi:hypothetical protein G6F43_006240 [Rhizopus delemar]|nr:hypothetical protein G6F43_006240 [Rhizopus delemar]
MFREDSDAMEYEYTHPHLHNTFKSDSFLTTQSHFEKQRQFMSSAGFVAKSIFDTSDTSTDTVCNLLDSFNIKEENKPQTKEKALIPRTPPSAPQKTNEEPDPIEPLTEKEITDIPLPSPMETPLTHTIHERHSHNHQTPTFIYNQAPMPAIDPLAESHSTIYYIMGLIKVGFASAGLSVILYLFIQFIRFIHHDMNAKITNYESNELNEQIYCQRQYEMNQCSPDTRLPAIAEWCQTLENCMLRPFSVSKSRVLAETLAEIANGFSDNITIKTMCLSIITGFGIIWSITNVLTRTKDNNARISSDKNHTKNQISDTENSKLLITC